MGWITREFRLYASTEGGTVRWLGSTVRGGGIRWTEQKDAMSFPSREALMQFYGDGSSLGQYRVRPGTEVVIERVTETSVWEGLTPL